MTTNNQPNLNEEDDNDAPIGHVLNRREVLLLLSGAGLSVLSTPVIARVSAASDVTPRAYLPILNRAATPSL